MAPADRRPAAPLPRRRPIAGPRPLPGEHLEQHQTGGVDVRSRGHQLAACLLRAEVVDAAEGRSGHRQLRLGEGPRDAEVGDLDAAGASQQHVGGLDVAMDYAARMRCVQRFVDLLGDARGGEWLEGAALANDGGQFATVDQLHDDERVALLHAVVVDVDHVGVAERRSRLSLLPEARHEGGVSPVLGTQHLDRHVTSQLDVVRAVDGCHAPLAEQLDQSIATGKYLSDFGQVFSCPVSRPLASPAAEARLFWPQLRSRPARKCRKSAPRSGRSSASSTEALSQPMVVPASYR